MGYYFLMVMAKQTRKGGISTVLALIGISLNWFFPELAKALFFGAVGDALKSMSSSSVAQTIAEYLPYSPWAILLIAGIMAMTGWGAAVTLHITRPFFRCSSKPKDSSNAEIESDFQIEIDTNTTRLGGYERICAITAKNVGATDLWEKCLVKITQMDTPQPDGMPMPFPLRTEMQILEERSGRFSLARQEAKTVPILFRNRKRKNEWFIYGGDGQWHFLPSGPVNLVIGVYGGDVNVTVLVTIIAGQDWEVVASITKVSENYILNQVSAKNGKAISSRISLLDLAREAEDRGWKFCVPNSNQILDLFDGIRQLGVDGTICISGRPVHNFLDLTHNEPLIRIAQDHWHSHEIDVFSFFKWKNNQPYDFAEDNFQTRVKELSVGNRETFADIHLDRAEALAWLQTDALAFRGRREKREGSA